MLILMKADPYYPYYYFTLTLNNININYFLQLLTFCLQTKAPFSVNSSGGSKEEEDGGVYLHYIIVWHFMSKESDQSWRL
jgi:hypothetical protein